MFRRLLPATASAASPALTAAPTHAIVGGSDAPAGVHPSIVEVKPAKGVLRTGALVAPDWILTAGHRGSVSGSAVAPPPLLPSRT